MRLYKLGILCAALLVGGCAASADYAWQRRDGRPAGGESFDYAISECRRISGRYDEEIMQRCMARFGYVWAPRQVEYYPADYRYSEYRPRRRHHHHRYDDD
jgi:hypothetical protein